MTSTGRKKEVKCHGFNAVQSCRLTFDQEEGMNLILLILTQFSVCFVHTYPKRGTLCFSSWFSLSLYSPLFS